MWLHRWLYVGQEDPMEEGMAIHSSILAWRIPWTEEPERLQYIGSDRVGHEWSDFALTHPNLSRNSWSNRLIWHWNTEWSRAKTNIEFFQENALVITNTLFQQHKRRLCTWTSPGGQHWNQTDYILCSQTWRSSIWQLAKTRLGADCGSDHELLTAKFRLKLKKVGKTNRPFRYDLNQIP